MQVCTINEVYFMFKGTPLRSVHFTHICFSKTYIFLLPTFLWYLTISFVDLSIRLELVI